MKKKYLTKAQRANTFITIIWRVEAAVHTGNTVLAAASTIAEKI